MGHDVTIVGRCRKEGFGNGIQPHDLFGLNIDSEQWRRERMSWVLLSAHFEPRRKQSPPLLQFSPLEKADFRICQLFASEGS